MNEDLIIGTILEQLNKVSKVKYGIDNGTVRCYIDRTVVDCFQIEPTKINVNFEDETVTIFLGGDRAVRLTTTGWGGVNYYGGD